MYIYSTGKTLHPTSGFCWYVRFCTSKATIRHVRVLCVEFCIAMEDGILSAGLTPPLALLMRSLGPIPKDMR